MSAHADVVVVGAGIIGLGAAYEAVKHGRSVIVVDRSSEPQGATIRNFGHLCFGAQAGQAGRYASASRTLWLELARQSGLWVRESGTHVVARHEDELAVLAAAAKDGGIDVLTASQLEQIVPVVAGVAVGGAIIHGDLQTDPRVAGDAMRAHLQELGVTFMLRTAVVAVESGAVQTTRGTITTDAIVVAVNHDIDQLFPDLADDHAIVRCALDMMSAKVNLRAPLLAPLLTGWSLTRYGRFANLTETSATRTRLHAERPELAVLDLNQMYTQRPDGSVIIGDTHFRGAAVSPFQTEQAHRALIAEAETLFGARIEVLDRWQGVYASGRDEFLIAEVMPGVLALAATTGIGMTCGLGLASQHVAALLGGSPSSEGTES